MRLLSLTLAAAVLLAANPGSAQDNWTHLFNGTDLSGWTQKGGKAQYRVENREIVGETVLGRENSFLCTEMAYDNFVLELEFKVDPRLNSGVQIRSECFETATQVQWKGRTIRIPANRVHGYQAEIDPDVARGRMWTAGIYDEARRMWLYPGELGGSSNVFSAQGIQIFKTNDWNRLRVVADGPSIKTYLNDTACADINDSMTPKGFIALQVHDIGNDASKLGIQVRFRDIRLRPIAAGSAKPDPAPTASPGPGR